MGGTYVLPFADYNSIIDLDKETAPQDVKPPETLSIVGNLIIEHGLQDQIGVSMLHRHFDLKQDEIMVHTQVDETVSECRPMPSRSPQLRPHAWFLLRNDFQPFEYTQRTHLAKAPELPHEFIKSIKRSLSEDALHQLALVSVEDVEIEADTVWVESVDEENRILRSKLMTTSEAAALPSVPTCWTVSRSQVGKAEFKIAGKCLMQPNGLHRWFDIPSDPSRDAHRGSFTGAQCKKTACI